MGIEIWMASAFAGGVCSLVAGIFIGRATLKDDVRRLQERDAQLLDRLHDALSQGPAGAEAAQIVVDTERRAVAALAGATPRERRRLLRGDPDAPGAPGAPGGEAQ